MVFGLLTKMGIFNIASSTCPFHHGHLQKSRTKTSGSGMKTTCLYCGVNDLLLVLLLWEDLRLLPLGGQAEDVGQRPGDDDVFLLCSQ